LQAILQRAFVYLFLQAKLEHAMKPYLQDVFGFNAPLTKFCIGLAAGGINGTILNPVIAIKHYTWGDKNRSFFSSAREMLKYGYKPFLNGMHTSMIRGMVFGGAYEVLRLSLYDMLTTHTTVLNKIQLQFSANCIAAGFGTMLASPFIFMRSLQHATPLGTKPSTMRALLQNTWSESKAYRSFHKLSFFSCTFRTFPGTVGAATRIGVAQYLCDKTRSILNA